MTDTDPLDAMIEAARELETAAQCVECSTAAELGPSIARLSRARRAMTDATNVVIRARRERA